MTGCEPNNARPWLQHPNLTQPTLFSKLPGYGNQDCKGKAITGLDGDLLGHKANAVMDYDLKHAVGLAYLGQTFALEARCHAYTADIITNFGGAHECRYRRSHHADENKPRETQFWGWTIRLLNAFGCVVTTSRLIQEGTGGVWCPLPCPKVLPTTNLARKIGRKW